METKWVYRFDEIEAAEAAAGGQGELKGLLGGKGANLAIMARIGIPVPPGFSVTTKACNAYLEAGSTFPKGMWEQSMEALESVSATTGKRLGDPANPLFVSCRSGARFSMPGMMDTVLNIGLNDETVEGLARMTADPRFAYDAYRRLVQMFSKVVAGIPDEHFEEVIDDMRRKEGVATDAELSADAWKATLTRFLALFRRFSNHDFPQDPYTQLRMSMEAVFKSWNSKRAVDYRNAAGIAHDLGTAVNIVVMVFGNMGSDSATGVAMTRSGDTGEKQIEGDYLTNAQGEDVVAGIRLTKDIHAMGDEFPKAYAELKAIAAKLESHYRDMQDVEFTIEQGKLWMLQTRDGKRTARAAVRIAVDMVEEGLISKEEALWRVSSDQVDFFLHPQFEPKGEAEAKSDGRLLGRGLNVSPGAACGIVALTADLAEAWAKKEDKTVIMVRPETKPDDVHGMLAAEGILTSRGGRTSHAALVARQFGKPAVVGVATMEIDMNKRLITFGDVQIKEGDWISIDGTNGEVYGGKLVTRIPDIQDPYLVKLLGWADAVRRLGVRANADYPEDAQRARDYGAEGIGLCRTEHMFFESDRLPHVQKLIMADLPVEEKEALDALLPYQEEDFAGLFRAMHGLPVIIRLIDPPLHEFLPAHSDLIRDLCDLKIRLQHAESLTRVEELLKQIEAKERILNRVEVLREANPMLGLRGVRLGIHIPELTVMQVRAIFLAACRVKKEGMEVYPEVMIPLTAHENELKIQRALLEKEARAVMDEEDMDIDYKFGTMIEIPRAALTADRLAAHADFFSFGTNDLTQTTYGISRDDAEAGFLIEYLDKGILNDNPFSTLDPDGVAQLMHMAVEKARGVKPSLECGICGEHGGDSHSIIQCHALGLDYVSCSPFRVPVARLAAAHAALSDSFPP